VGIWNCIEKLLLFLLGAVLKQNKRKTIIVFHSVFCTSMASDSLQVLDLVTIQPPHFITKLGKIAGVLQLRCNGSVNSKPAHPPPGHLSGIFLLFLPKGGAFAKTG